jgi:Lamin Tail Domain
VDVRRQCRILAATAAAVGALALAVGGCFDPRFADCTVACGDGDSCPEDQFCLTDGWCHASQDDEMMCTPGGDADGSVPDGPPGGEDGGPIDPDGGGGDGGKPDASPGVTPVPDDILITEIHRDPQRVGDDVGEWFEILNVTREKTLDLAGLQMADNNGMFIVEESVIVQPGQRALFGILDDPDMNGGVDLDYAYGGALALSNDQPDRIVITDPANVDQGPLDSVALDVTTFPDVPGASLNLDEDIRNPAQNNNNAMGVWCSSIDRFPPNTPDGDFGTPGGVNIQCPRIGPRPVAPVLAER